MRVISTVLMAIGAIGIIVIAAMLMGLVLFSLDPPIKDQLVKTSVSSDAVKSFDQKVAAFKQKIESSIAAKEKNEVMITVTSEEINSKMIELLAQGDLPFKETLINFDNNLCKVYTLSNNPGINAKIGLIAQLMVTKGDVKIVVVDFQLGKLPLPQPIVKEVGNILDVLYKMQGITEDLHIDITSIAVSDGKLTLKATTKPPAK